MCRPHRHSPQAGERTRTADLRLQGDASVWPISGVPRVRRHPAATPDLASHTWDTARVLTAIEESRPRAPGGVATASPGQVIPARLADAESAGSCAGGRAR
jgi:hypothetical protein